LKFQHEFRDPIHAFVRMDSYERKVVDSEPFQRLRQIHQLALSFLVYPGATHKRFEHSLGVMELAGRVFDTVTTPEKLEQAHDLVQPLTVERNVSYWRNVVRMAALCHDLGHLPFSHATEGLLPDGENHETLTKRFIEDDEIRSILTDDVDPPVRVDDVVQIATETPGLPPWKQLLAEIIQSPFFGVDRIDYLLRDSWHAGVAYGRFDHFRLLDTIRILPSAPAEEPGAGDEPEEATTPALGVERGGLESAEALVLARYFMFSQVYYHEIRQIYDIHLGDFLRAWLPDGRFPTEPAALLRLNDSGVLEAIREASADEDHPGHDPAYRITRRKHFKLLFRPSLSDYRINLEAGSAIEQAAIENFGAEAVRRAYYPPKAVPLDFPVLVKGNPEAASSHLEVFTTVPATRLDAVYIRPDLHAEAEAWLSANRQNELENRAGEESDDEA
jgi:uncharacterized protein